MINDLARRTIAVTGWPDTIWLTQQTRTDDSYAVFGELYYDITDKLTATRGLSPVLDEGRPEGILRFSGNYSLKTGEARASNHGRALPRRALRQPESRHGRKRRYAQVQPGLQVRRRAHGLRHLLRGLPAGRRESPWRRSRRTRPTTSRTTRRAGRRPGPTARCASTAPPSSRSGTTSSTRFLGAERADQHHERRPGARSPVSKPTSTGLRPTNGASRPARPGSIRAGPEFLPDPALDVRRRGPPLDDLPG